MEVTEQTKHNLKEAFWSLYRKKSIEKITVKEITTLAGYNRGTFYLYFRDTYDVLAQMEDELLTVVRNLIAQWLEEDARHNLSTHMGNLMELAKKYSSYIGVLLSAQGDPMFASRLKEILRPIIVNWVLIDQPLNALESDMLTDFYLSGLLSVIAKWLNEQQDMTIHQFVQFIVQHLFPTSLPNHLPYKKVDS